MQTLTTSIRLVAVTLFAALGVGLSACAGDVPNEGPQEPAREEAVEKTSSALMPMAGPCDYICYQGPNHGCGSSPDQAYQNLPGGGHGTIYCW
jgi:hypothetical protein